MDSWFGLLIVAAVLAGLLTCWLIWRARMPSLAGLPTMAAKAKGLLAKPQVQKGLALLTYLTTRRERHYQTPWVLLLGDQGAGKSSLVASVSRTLVMQESTSVLGDMEGMTWHKLVRGMVIDPAGSLCAAAAGSKEEKQWLGALQHVVDQRPERPIDGIVLAVSARTLLNLSGDALTAAAEQAYLQLDRVQDSFEFVLPVYVVVTQCDAVPGFSAFWQTLPDRYDGMVGWSAPPHAESQTPAEWAASAYSMVIERLKALQLEVAASSKPIGDVDRFFLFPRRFQNLQSRLGLWLSTALRPSPWNAGFLCRGIYFTGSVVANGDPSGAAREDVAFVNHLFDRKVLAERGLARPTRKGIWSRNGAIRSLQRAAIAGFVLMLVGMGVSSYQLNRQINVLSDSLSLIRNNWKDPAEKPCASKNEVFDLITQVAKIRAKTVYLALPASWVDRRVTKWSDEVIVEEAFRQVIMPSVGCHLLHRAHELDADAAQRTARQGSPGKDSYENLNDALFQRIAAAEAFEENLSRFRLLSHYNATESDQDVMDAFAALIEYVYDSPLPDGVRDPQGAFAQSLAELTYPAERQFTVPPNLRSHVVEQVTALAAKVRRQLGQDVAAGPDLLSALQQEQEPVAANARRLGWWLNWVNKSWIGSSAAANPCADTDRKLSQGARRLTHFNGVYSPLEKLSAAFSAQGCYEPAMRTIGSLRLAPYGAVFPEQNGVLSLNPALAAELDGLTNLLSLDFMQLAQARDFSCQVGRSAWNPSQLGLANHYIEEYQRFARRADLPPLGTTPPQRTLYDRIARSQLERALNDAFQAAQQAPSDAVPLRQVGVESLSDSEVQLDRESRNFADVVPPISDLMFMYGQFKFTTSRDAIVQCTRQYATESLRRIVTLADESRLYDPAPANDGMVFQLGNPSALENYLNRHLDRASVLSRYVRPFVKFLKNNPGDHDAHLIPSQTGDYWNNTIAEINAYMESKNPAGDVALLNDLFLKQLSGLSYANCNKQLGDKPSAPQFNLFAERRWQMELRARELCAKQTDLSAEEAYRKLAVRFNLDLAGRYPFADANHGDAPVAVVKAFFTDYLAQRDALRQSLAPLKDPKWTPVRAFLDQLDGAAAFFQASVLAPDPGRPVKLSLGFRAQAAASPGSDQVVAWAMTIASASAGYPNRATALDWNPGDGIELDLTWADYAQVAPAADTKQAGVKMEGKTVTYLETGEWALLRFIDDHRSVGGGAADAAARSQVLLEFNVPVVPLQGANTKGRNAALYMTLAFPNPDGKGPTAPLLKPPGRFPSAAPIVWRKE